VPQGVSISDLAVGATKSMYQSTERAKPKTAEMPRRVKLQQLLMSSHMLIDQQAQETDSLAQTAQFEGLAS